MRDLLNDLDAGRDQAPDPMRSAQQSMRPQLPKRFYAQATVEPREEGHAVLLDGKPVRTPGKAVLALPTEAAAVHVAHEFEAQVEVIDLQSMPVLRLVNTAIDGVAVEMQAVIEDVMRFASTDLLCYRADAPEGLVERQAARWDPVLDWARASLGARFVLAEGVMHVAQPRETIGAVGIWLRQREDPFRLAAIHLMTTLTGSALLALATEAGAISSDEAWSAAHVDEDWNIEQWGEDAEAAARRASRRKDFDAAVRLADSLTTG